MGCQRVSAPYRGYKRNKEDEIPLLPSCVFCSTYLANLFNKKNLFLFFLLWPIPGIVVKIIYIVPEPQATDCVELFTII